jgi:beta-aspartyl-peptidase (threonine type)
MIHGGAGELVNIDSDKMAVRYIESMRVVLNHGRSILNQGGSAMEAVEQCAALLEDDPIFNAGMGSVLNEDGKVEMDAAIMNGNGLNAGAVAGIHNIPNPIHLARVVLEESEHVMLIGEGAERFAQHHGFEFVNDDYLITRKRRNQWEVAHRKGQMGLDHDSSEQQEEINEDKYGTIGAIAKDKHGNLAAATSTGGIVNKRFGRVGDSPIIGAGVYADNETCAISCTGFGEDFMRVVLAKTVSDLIEFKKLDAQVATKQGLEYLTKKVKGRGGFILIDKEGKCASGYTTAKMIHGWIEEGGEPVYKF